MNRKRLGELVIRSENPQALVRFYREVIGLKSFAAFETATFLKIADDFKGHPQLLAIFDKAHKYSGPQAMQVDRAESAAGTLHHFAFAMDLEEFKAEQDRLQKLGVELELGEHPPFGWRSIYMHDPDGNSVEMVCYDASVLDPILNQKVRSASEDIE
ncbi:VOC family protein [Tichowtungia aerotolerans]|uniref:VOC domain-containing protein n=1 Tax=Tichowtungia aerotolerans TaxID=2697043 RepID=A0A6P1M8R6_9BACT|nr:VOC family protein [Tichowtungia aerotolerans]QHI70287.1 hypothetical protein GT409_12825 [Tichowtungia aerotolerans]